MATKKKGPGEKKWELVRWYVREGRFRIEERTLTAFQWLYSPQQHRIVSRADLEVPSRIDKTMLASLKINDGSVSLRILLGYSYGQTFRDDGNESSNIRRATAFLSTI